MDKLLYTKLLYKTELLYTKLLYKNNCVTRFVGQVTNALLERIEGQLAARSLSSINKLLYTKCVYKKLLYKKLLYKNSCSTRRCSTKQKWLHTKEWLYTICGANP